MAKLRATALITIMIDGEITFEDNEQLNREDQAADALLEEFVPVRFQSEAEISHLQIEEI